MVFLRRRSRALDIQHGVVVPFVKLAGATECESSLEPGKADGDLRCVDHYSVDRDREASFAEEGVHTHLRIGGIALEVALRDCGLCGLLILNIWVMGVLDYAVEVAGEEEVVVDWENYRMLDGGGAIREDHGLRCVVREVVEIPDDGADKVRTVLGRVAGFPRPARIGDGHTLIVHLIIPGHNHGIGNHVFNRVLARDSVGDGFVKILEGRRVMQAEPKMHG